MNVQYCSVQDPNQAMEPSAVSGPPHINEHNQDYIPQRCEQGPVAHVILEPIKLTVNLLEWPKVLSILIFKAYTLIPIFISQEF